MSAGPHQLRGTRREMLAALLGSAVAAGCPKRAPVRGWDGELVADFAVRGHRIRDARAAPVAAGAPKAVSVLVLGGGVAGLTAAWSLRRAGRDDVLVLELGDEVGGTAASGRSAVSAYPWGAHYVPAPTPENTDLVALLEELGAVEARTARGAPIYAEHALCASPKERIFFQGTWQAGLVPRLGESRAEAEQWARFDAEVEAWVRWRDADGRRAFTLPLAHGSDAPRVRALDTITFAEWLEQRGLTAPRLRWYAAYACRDDFGTTPEQTSAFYGLHYFCARVPAPGEASAEFLTWPQGNGRIVQHLASRIGASRIRTGQIVQSVLPEESGVRVLARDVASGEARSYLADKVVFALPSFLRRYLLADAPEYHPGYAPWMVANLHLAGRPGYRGFETAWDNVIYDSQSLGYVVADHQTRLAVGPTVWTWYLPLVERGPKAAREALLELGWREASDLAVADLSRAHNGLQPELRRIDVRRWGHGMVRPEPGMRFSSSRALAAAPWRNVHFAHTDLSGVALVEEAVYHGARAAKEVLAGV